MRSIELMIKMIEIIDEGIKIEELNELLDKTPPRETSPYSISNEEKPKPKEKKTYTQNWAAYDEAKTNEDILFKSLLKELLYFAVKYDPVRKRGGQSFSKRDSIFAMAMKIFYKSDLRKTESILKELKRLHYIDRVPSFKTICNFFNDTSISPILDDLILITSLPLAHIENTCAMDSTGFSTSKFTQWSEFKWGSSQGKERIWNKAHVALGCVTNVFFSVSVTPKNVSDAVMVEEVLENIKLFSMDNFVADKAYSSRRILNFLSEIGLNPYIPFKKNTTGRSLNCPLWHKLFYEFRYNSGAFMEKYHKRSNVETGFFMVKQRFGDYLMSKNFEANVNEIKIKFLCHNICVLIQEIFERNIVLDFEGCVKKIVLCNKE